MDKIDEDLEQKFMQIYNLSHLEEMRSAWIDIQDIVNQGQTNKIILHEPNNNDIQ